MRNARFCTRSMLSGSLTGRALCHTGQQYSRTDLMSAKSTLSRLAGGIPLRLRTRRICSLFDALATTSLMCKSNPKLRLCFLCNWVLLYSNKNENRCT